MFAFLILWSLDADAQTQAQPEAQHAEEARPTFPVDVEVSLTASAQDAQVILDADDTPVPLPFTFRHPPGSLRLRVFAPGYRVSSTELQLVAGQPVSYHVELDRLSVAERDYIDRARTHSKIRAGFFWSGVGLLGAGLVFVLLPGPDSPAQNALYARFTQARTRAEGDRLYAELSQNADRAMALRTASFVLLGLGVAASITSVFMWLFAPEPPASSKLRDLHISPLGVSGSF